MTVHIVEGKNYNCGLTPVTIPVDSCVADIVQALINAGIYTGGACCGHGVARCLGFGHSGTIALIDGRTVEVHFPDDWAAHREAQ